VRKSGIHRRLERRAQCGRRLSGSRAELAVRLVAPSGRRLSLIPIDWAAFSYQGLDWSRAVLLDDVFTIAVCLSFETGALAGFVFANCSSHWSIRSCGRSDSALSFDHRRSCSAIVAGFDRTGFYIIAASNMRRWAYLARAHRSDRTQIARHSDADAQTSLLHRSNCVTAGVPLSAAGCNSII
jgi:hypothetical protein